jgi:hypothetical protein
MEFDYENAECLHTDNFSAGLEYWHHEGIGAIGPAPGGGMRLHCAGSRQGGEGCMAFFRPTLPDRVAYEYDLTVRSHGGLVINYLAIRGLRGEDMIEECDRLEPRTGIMANYYARKWGLQSYHVSISRFNDAGEHTGTCNWRRNPGSILMAHGVDLVREINRRYRIRIVKDGGHCQLYVDGCCAHGFVDRAAARGPTPDGGKFGFRLIGSDVMADVENFAVFRVKENRKVWGDHADFTG